MILTGSTELNGLDAGLEKDALCTPGKNQELRKVNNTTFLCNLLVCISAMIIDNAKMGIVKII